MGQKGLLALLLGMLTAAASAGAGRLAGKMPLEMADKSSTQAEGKLAKGRRLFLSYCATCHGPRGDGKPARGLKLKPPALDLTSFELSDSFIRKALEEGIPGTGMAAWNSLPPNELSAVAAYTASLGRHDRLSPQRRMAPDNVLQEAGRRVYLVHCARCHGEQGRGDGPEASGYKPPPPSFAEMRPSYAAAARAITEGIPGTTMPAWLRLTPAEIQAVTFHIRSLYGGTVRAAEPPSTTHRGKRMAQQ
jgi:cytochrome c oxidase cbb3-type subunit I/II